ncbi:Uncharacterized protein Fot_06116 [Forsythia ovata]|uniref:Uncharacterized protein n=1 Tax=Forsythia ovata TaxID=205694 RepID=A0ABD1WSE1_9LAMI
MNFDVKVERENVTGHPCLGGESLEMVRMSPLAIEIVNKIPVLAKARRMLRVHWRCDFSTHYLFDDMSLLFSQSMFCIGDALSSYIEGIRNERFIKLRFINQIEKLEEERIIATVWGWKQVVLFRKKEFQLSMQYRKDS